MTVSEAIKTYKLPAKSTPEDLECHWNKVVTYGDKILIAWYFYMGPDKPGYFAAVYEFLTDDHTCEGEVGLRAASDLSFEDDGHALAWAIQNA